MYEENSEPQKLIRDMTNNFYLVNIVRNDFRNPDRLAIFHPFDSQNGHVSNGDGKSHDRTVSINTAT